MVYMIYPGAYIGFEKGGKAVTTAMRLEGPTLRRDGLQGTGCPLSLESPLWRFQVTFFDF